MRHLNNLRAAFSKNKNNGIEEKEIRSKVHFSRFLLPDSDYAVSANKDSIQTWFRLFFAGLLAHLVQQHLPWYREMPTEENFSSVRASSVLA